MKAFPILALAGVAALAAACMDTMPEPPRTAQMGVNLTGAQEVPPAATAGWGHGAITYDRVSNQMTWTLTYTGLTGPLQGAHIHGPAATGTNAGVMINIPVSHSPLQGSAMLTEAQEAELMAGRLYVNLHTPTFPNGEIRGQLIPGTPVVNNPAPPPRPLATAPSMAPQTTSSSQTTVVPSTPGQPGSQTTTTVTTTTTRPAQ